MSSHCYKKYAFFLPRKWLKTACFCIEDVILLLHDRWGWSYVSVIYLNFLHVLNNPAYQTRIFTFTFTLITMVLQLMNSLFYCLSWKCERGFPTRKTRSRTQKKYQFSPLREGLPTVVPLLTYPLHISILAPARGASVWPGIHFDRSEFQFSPLREGLRLPAEWVQRRRSNFNSRPCERGFAVCHPDFVVADISILAPARGASQ